MPKVQSSISKDPKILDLSDTFIRDTESVIKYIRLVGTHRQLIMCRANLNLRNIRVLTRDLVAKEIPLHSLDLSYNIGINDKSCKILAQLFSKKSNIKHLFLDGTNITEKGFAEIMTSLRDNFKARKLTFRHCKICLELE